MKKFLVLSLIGLFFACSSPKKEYSVIKGKITGAKENVVKILLDGVAVSETTLKADGSFVDTLKLTESNYYILGAGEMITSFYVKPGAELSINAVLTNGNADVVFAGDCAKENDYLLFKTTKVNVNMRELFAFEENIFLAKIDSLIALHEKELSKSELDPNFVMLEKANLQYYWALRKDSYGASHASLTGKSDFTVSANFNNYKSKLELNREDLFVLPAYKRYLFNYIFNKAEANLGEKSQDSKLLLEEKLKIVKSEFKGDKILNFIKFELIKESIEESGAKASQQIIDEFKATCKDSSKIKEIETIELKFAATENGSPAPDFTLTNLKGEQVTLSSFKGKAVIVDFWATWCGPCKVSFPGMQKAANKLKDVVFLFINTWEQVPNKKENAEKFIKENKYTFNVLLDEKDEVVAKYNVSGIPTKFLIDKEGNIKDKKVGGNDNADEIVKEIEEWIKTVK